MGNTALELTVLTTLGVKAVKTYTNRGGKKIDVEGYGRAKTFTAETIEVDDRGKWLKRLRNRPNSFVVLGQPKDWKKGEKKRRLSSDRDGNEATIVDVPRGWMPIDVDAIDFEPFSSIDDGEGFAYELLSRLGLSGVRCVWHLTNSHGFFEKYRGRLWIELATPLTAAQMKEYAKSRWGDIKVDVDGKMKPIVDLAVYQPQQPIYTGDPILEGVESPVDKRVGFIDGDALEAKTKKSKRKDREGDEDPNIQLLRDEGLYIGRLKPGQHMMECPWEHQHSGEERDDDTFYFEAHHNGYDHPSFKCHHGSCEDRHWADVLEYLDKEVPEDQDDRDRSPHWVYVHRLKNFWDARDGALIDRDSYDTTHGGGAKGKKPSDRFIAAKKTQKADVVEFIPGHERFVHRGQVKVLNTYIDQRIRPDAETDHDFWEEHLEWCVPNDDDREHLMDWLAWSYQHPGKKITWAPILYGPPGTGKTTIFNALAHCIGLAHVSEPTQAELEDKFNDWCFGKMLVKIEELMSGDKYHVAEKLKPIVANPTVSVRRMHQTGFTVPNVANVCASTNHMQALPIERGDRRYMLIECVDAAESVRRPRMRDFYKRLSEVGYTGIAHWLNTRDVSKFVPTAEAPMTKLKAIVQEASMTDIERAVELCDVFDGNDIISSSLVLDYLEQNGLKVNDRRLGLIAARRQWVSLPGREGRTRIGNRKVTCWTSKSGMLKLRAFLAKKPGERERLHSNLAAKMNFNEVEDDSEAL